MPLPGGEIYPDPPKKALMVYEWNEHGGNPEDVK